MWLTQPAATGHNNKHSSALPSLGFQTGSLEVQIGQHELMFASTAGAMSSHISQGWAWECLWELSYG